MPDCPGCRLEIRHGSLLEAEADAVVNPANSLGIMGGGVAGILRRAAGPEVEEEARRYAPIALGTAVVTGGGRSRFTAIIHAPTMSAPGSHIPVHNVRLAIRAALAVADSHGYAALAVPGMGTGVGGVRPIEAAEAMMDEIARFHAHRLQTVTLIDIDPAMVEAWRQCAGERPF